MYRPGLAVACSYQLVYPFLKFLFSITGGVTKASWLQNSLIDIYLERSRNLMPFPAGSFNSLVDFVNSSTSRIFRRTLPRFLMLLFTNFSVKECYNMNKLYSFLYKLIKIFASDSHMSSWELRSPLDKISSG